MIRYLTHLSLVVLWGLIAFALPATADPLFGVFANDQAQVSLNATNLIGVFDNQSWNTRAILPQTTLTFQPLTLAYSPSVSATFCCDPATGSSVFVTASMFGDASVSGSISNGALHEVALTSASDAITCQSAWPFICTHGGALANAYGQWDDTASVVGPANMPIVLEITHHLSGTIVNGGLQNGGNAQATFEVGDTNNGQFAFWQDTPTTSGPVNISETAFLTVRAGDVLSIENQLSVNAQLEPLIAPAFDTSGADFGDTASFFIDVLTPGASLQTASGLDYATPVNTSVPEPGTAILSVGAMIALVWVRKKRAA